MMRIRRRCCLLTNGSNNSTDHLKSAHAGTSRRRACQPSLTGSSHAVLREFQHILTSQTSITRDVETEDNSDQTAPR